MAYLGVIGHPLKKSLSPVFQQAALDHLKLPHTYEAWPTPADGLETRIMGLRAPTVLGANVTIPHKEAVVPFLDGVDELSRKVGAVNTIVNADGKLYGHNTDVEGSLRALREDGGFEPERSHVVVAGAGGAARAVVVAMIEARATEVTVINRTLDRAEALVRDLSPLGSETKVRAMPDTADSWSAASDGCDLLINCTSLGSTGTGDENASPAPVSAIRPGMLVYDIIYRPLETRLMREAKELGARVLGGLPMLIYQGAASFKLWTGLDAPVDVMSDAARKALETEDA